MLPADELKHLEDLGLDYSVEEERGMVCVVVSDFALPSGYNRELTDLLLRLPKGFPDIPPDMWWMAPEVLYLDGGTPPATELREEYLGSVWQRWSRHFGTTPWRPGRDSLRSYLQLIRTDLEKGAGAKA